MTNDRARMERDIGLFRAIRNALRAAAHDRGHEWTGTDQLMITRFFLEYIEAKGLRVVPYQPDRPIQDAIDRALEEGKRMSVAWVGKRHKNTWRYRAALDAAPNWRKGHDAELKDARQAEQEKA